MAEPNPVSDRQERYLPALRFKALTGIYDPFIRWTTRERAFRERLLAQAKLAPGQRVLDVGCGTGTLLLLAKRREPGIDAVGLDGDSEILERAQTKVEASGLDIHSDEGLSFELPYPDDSFDRVLSSLFFHHLTTADKRRTLAEIARVLRPGGELHVADWGRPADPLMRGLFEVVRRFDGIEQTRANLAGQLPDLFQGAGLKKAGERDRLRTPFGTLSLYSALQHERSQ